MQNIIIVGGGAAGFFTAINIAEKLPSAHVTILERGSEVLKKVKVSGGGRCNVTHGCFDANELTKNYPRGEKELRGPFHKFGATETIEWFNKRGIELKTEADGRMFPISNSSQTVIDCFVNETRRLNIKVELNQSVYSIEKQSDGWKIITKKSEFFAHKLVLATGSNPKIWNLLSDLGHKIISPVASLFTFNIKDDRIDGLAGVSTLAEIKVNGAKLSASGPLLITHWGMSGPAILKLSAWGARILADKNYDFTISINWLPYLNSEAVLQMLKGAKKDHAKKTIAKKESIDLPNRLWERLLTTAQIPLEIKWADLSKNQINELVEQLLNGQFNVSGKSTFKEEFVTAGGIDLKEIDFKTMQSKLHDNLFFAGEIANIDAITGGFNFQNAWTSGFIIAEGI